MRKYSAERISKQCCTDVMMKLQSDCLEERISAYQCQGSKDLNISKPFPLMTLWLYMISWSFF
jgi:hypothetical protein